MTNDIATICVVTIVGFGGLFGFIYLLDRSSKAQARIGKPSWLIRIAAIGLLGLLVLAILANIKYFLSSLLLELGVIAVLAVIFSIFRAPKARSLDEARREIAAQMGLHYEAIPHIVPSLDGRMTGVYRGRGIECTFEEGMEGSDTTEITLSIAPQRPVGMKASVTGVLNKRLVVRAESPSLQAFVHTAIQKGLGGSRTRLELYIADEKLHFAIEKVIEPQVLKSQLDLLCDIAELVDRA